MKRKSKEKGDELTMLRLCSAAMAKPKAMISKRKTVKRSSLDAIVEQVSVQSFADLFISAFFNPFLLCYLSIYLLTKQRIKASQICVLKFYKRKKVQKKKKKKKKQGIEYKCPNQVEMKFL